MQGVLNLTNTKTNAFVTATGIDYYSTDITNLMYFGWTDSIGSIFTPVTMNIIPQTAMIGASGVIGSYSGSGTAVGETDTFTWQLTNANNGLANLVIADSTFTGSTFDSSTKTTYVIDQQGNRQSVTVVISYANGVIVTLSGN